MAPGRKVLGGWLTLLLGAAIVLGLQAPPAPRPATAPAEAFSADRALVQVRQIAQAPHPLGTPEHDRVRDHLLGALRDLGFEPRLQRALAHRTGRGGQVVLASVENIVAERPGAAPTGTVVLAAHYDSHGTGPGAADDGAGVATLLEAARALAPGRNTLRILLTDAEEVGLLGAQAHVDDLAGQAPFLVLNFEARGGGGPVFMFETSDANLELMRVFQRAAPRPHSSSLMQALYRTLPNDTDLTVFKQAGMAGLNFAFVDRWDHYHTQLDTADGLDLRSLQQQGDLALALARACLAADLPALTRPGAGDAVHFDLLGRWLVVHPARWAWALTLAVAGAFAAGLWAWRKEPAFGPGLAAGLGLGLLTLVLGALVGLGLGAAVRPLQEGLPNHDPAGVRWFQAALAALVLAPGLALWRVAHRRWPGRGLSLGALLPWLLALVAATTWMPGATYLFTWPLAFSLAALATRRAWLAAAPVLLLLLPVWVSLGLMLGFSLPAALGLLAAFFWIPLLPLGARLLPAVRPWAPALLLGAGALCFAAGTRVAGPRIGALVHLEEPAEGRAHWVSPLPPDAWTRPLLGPTPGSVRLVSRPAPAGPAPRLGLAAPGLHRQGDRLVLDLPDRALAVVLAADSPFRQVQVAGRTLPGGRSLHWFGPPPHLELELTLPPGTPLRVDLIRPGLPDQAPPRPAGMLPAPVDPYTDTRITRTTLVW